MGLGQGIVISLHLPLVLKHIVFCYFISVGQAQLPDKLATFDTRTTPTPIAANTEHSYSEKLANIDDSTILGML